MKNLIIKYSNSIIALVMIAVYGVGAMAATPWTVNPGDYRYDMSLYLDVTFTEGKMDYSQYDVAVFSGNQCRGIAEVLSLGDGKQCLYLRARSNQESGETMTFKYYNKETGEIQPIDGVSFTFESNGRLGYPSDPYIVKIIRHFDVDLSAGNGGSINQEGGRVAEGTELTITATPYEGYHFEQWSDGNTDNPRTITIDTDVTLSAEFGVNTYKLIYNVGGNLYKEYEVDYASAITPEALPEREGYTFSGWDNVPATMPAHDVTISGTFAINSYDAIFKIGDEVFKTVSVVYGQPVVAPEAPAKEGYTFEGWQNVPEAMPAHEVTVIASFTINSYCLNLYLNDELYSSELVEYGSKLEIEVPEVSDGKKFDGWINEIPCTMPAHDVDIYGVVSDEDVDCVFNIYIDDNNNVRVYNIKGQLLYENVKLNDIKFGLQNGLYIINGTKCLIRK